MTASLRDGVTVAGVSGACVGAKFTTFNVAHFAAAWRRRRNAAAGTGGEL